MYTYILTYTGQWELEAWIINWPEELNQIFTYIKFPFIILRDPSRNCQSTAVRLFVRHFQYLSSIVSLVTESAFICQPTPIWRRHQVYFGSSNFYSNEFKCLCCHFFFIERSLTDWRDFYLELERKRFCQPVTKKWWFCNLCRLKTFWSTLDVLWFKVLLPK